MHCCSLFLWALLFLITSFSHWLLTEWGFCLHSIDLLIISLVYHLIRFHISKQYESWGPQKDSCFDFRESVYWICKLIHRNLKSFENNWFTEMLQNFQHYKQYVKKITITLRLLMLTNFRNVPGPAYHYRVWKCLISVLTRGWKPIYNYIVSQE